MFAMLMVALINSEFFSKVIFLHPFLANVPTLYPHTTPENQRFSGVFRGYKMGTLARNGLIVEVNHGEKVVSI